MAIRARHTVSGVIAEVQDHIFYHPDLGRYLERVDENAKPYLPEMHIPREADRDELIFAGADHSDEPIEPEFEIVGYIEAPETEDED